MIIKIISEIFGSLFCYEVFEIRRVCVCVFLCAFFKKLGYSHFTHTQDFQGINMSYFLTKSGMKRDEKNAIFGQAQLFNDRAGCPKQASVLCAPENPG